MTDIARDPVRDWATDFDHTHPDYAAAATEIERSFDKRFDVTPGARLVLSHGDGELFVTPWDEAATAVALAWLGVAIGLWRAYPTILLQACSARGAGARDALPLDELIEPGTRPLSQLLDVMHELRDGVLAGKVMVQP